MHSPASGSRRSRKRLKRVRGKIKLNIELKPTKTDREQLSRVVAKLIGEQEFESDCFVTSLDHEAVEIAHRAESEAAHRGDRVGGGRRHDDGSMSTC